MNQLESGLQSEQRLDVPVRNSAPVGPEVVAFRCGSCGTRIESSKRLAGRGAPCPNCHQWVVVPFGNGLADEPESEAGPEVGAPERPPVSGAGRAFRWVWWLILALIAGAAGAYAAQRWLGAGWWRFW
jgi:hypothetical protein